MAECRDLEPLFAPTSTAKPRRATVRRSTRISAAVRRAATALPPSGWCVKPSWPGAGRLRDVRIGRLAAALRSALSAQRGPDGRASVRGRWLSLPAPRDWVPLSMVATLVLAVAGVFLYGLSGSVEALATQLAADHVKCFEFASLPTILPDAKALGREWADSRGWSVKVPESARSSSWSCWAFAAASRPKATTAHLMYKWRGQPLVRLRAQQRAPARGLGSAAGRAARSGSDDLVEGWPHLRGRRARTAVGDRARGAHTCSDRRE